MAFPASPTNGQIYVQSGTSYIYDSTYGVWNINTTAINADTLDGIDSTGFITSTNGKAPDSDLLDGLNSTQFLRSDTSGTVTGTVTIRPSTPTGLGTAPAGVTAYMDSSTNNYLLFRNTADNGTYSGIVMQDNNIGGYCIFGNAGGGGDKMYVGGYGGVDIQAGTSDSVNPAARTTIASFTSGGMSVTSITETSSIRFKENVVPITNAIEKVSSLQGVTYDRIDTGAKNESGLIAEEVFKVLPNLVELDEAGNPTGVKYTKTIAYLIECVKELQSQIDELKRSK